MNNNPLSAKLSNQAPLEDTLRKEYSIVFSSTNLQAAQSPEIPSEYLSLQTIRKMIKRLLSEALPPYTIGTLASILGTNAEDINMILSDRVSVSIINKIALPLIKCYCQTEWPEYKNSSRQDNSAENNLLR